MYPGQKLGHRGLQPNNGDKKHIWAAARWTSFLVYILNSLISGAGILLPNYNVPSILSVSIKFIHCQPKKWQIILAVWLVWNTCLPSSTVTDKYCVNLMEFKKHFSDTSSGGFIMICYSYSRHDLLIMS